MPIIRHEKTNAAAPKICRRGNLGFLILLLSGISFKFTLLAARTWPIHAVICATQGCYDYIPIQTPTQLLIGGFL
jgi:hypothetical protein